MKNHVIIVSAGKYAREVYSWVVDCIQAGAPWEFKGFLDNRPNVLDDFPCSAGIISSVDDYVPQPGDRFVCAIGEAGARKAYVARLKAKGAQFASVIHPTAVIGQNVKMGEGVILAPYSVLTAALEIGNFVNIGVFSCCSHHNRIGDWCQISGHCSLPGDVVLDEGVFVGCGVVFVPGARVGTGAYVGAGSVVLRRVKARTKVFGNPAVVIGSVDCEST